MLFSANAICNVIFSMPGDKCYAAKKVVDFAVNLISTRSPKGIRGRTLNPKTAGILSGQVGGKFVIRVYHRSWILFYVSNPFCGRVRLLLDVNVFAYSIAHPRFSKCFVSRQHADIIFRLAFIKIHRIISDIRAYYP